MGKKKNKNRNLIYPIYKATAELIEEICLSSLYWKVPDEGDKARQG